MFLTNILWCMCFNFALSNDYFKELLARSSISRAAARIIYDFYVKETSIVVLTTGYVDSENRLRQSDLINEIMNRDTKIDVKFRIQDFSHISSSYPEEYNLIFIDSYEGFS